MYDGALDVEVHFYIQYVLKMGDRYCDYVEEYGQVGRV